MSQRLNGPLYRIELFALSLAIALTLFAVSGAKPTVAQQSDFPRTLTDGAGTQITINAKPVRIVSAALVSDEILFSLVDKSRLVAITANAEDPAQSDVVEAAKDIPNKIVTVDPEPIVSWKPDLVVVSPFTDAGVVKQLRDAKLPVLALGYIANIKDIETNVTLLGQAVGAEDKAAQIINDMETRLKDIATAVKDVKPLTVLYYGPEGYSSGANTTIDEVITRAGGINIVTKGGIKESFPQLNDEFVVTQNPDVILLAGFNSYSPGFVDKFYANPNFQTLKAVKNKRVLLANDAHIATVSQYIVDGVSDVAALLYPDVYKSAAVGTASAATPAATAAK